MTDVLTVRKAVHDFVDKNPQADYERVVSVVCSETGAAEKTVCDEISKLESEGFVYCVESGDTTEVKVA
jgi:hypothetical protein